MTVLTLLGRCHSFQCLKDLSSCNLPILKLRKHVESFLVTLV